MSRGELLRFIACLTCHIVLALALEMGQGKVDGEPNGWSGRGGPVSESVASFPNALTHVEKVSSPLREGIPFRNLLQRDERDDHPCRLTREERDAILNESDGVWTITRSYLEGGDRDVQAVVNCTREGDRVVFQEGETFNLTHRIEIPWNLTLSSSATSTGSANSTRSRQHEGAALRCRPGEGAFLIRSGGVVLESITFENCSLDHSRVHAAIVEMAADCPIASRTNDIVFRYVRFQRNALREGTAIEVVHPKCASVEMLNVTFSDNKCSGACFGLLAGSNTLTNVSMERNVKSDDGEHVFAMLSLPEGSDTQATGLMTRDNELTVVLDRFGARELRLKGSQFVGNRGRNVIQLTKTEKVKISDCVFSGNKAEGLKGAAVFYATDGHLDISDSTFEENVADEGGAITSEETSLRITRCNFTGNHAERDGGAISVEGGDLEVTASRCSANRANTSAGCIYLSKVNRFRIKDTNFIQNVATEEGGALTISRSSGVLMKSFFGENSADRSGAISVALESVLKIKESRLADNEAADVGGAILCRDIRRIILVDSIFERNSASNSGGAISLKASTMKAQNVTIVNNTNNASGGGIRAHDGSHLDITNSTFLSNTAVFGGSMSFRTSFANISYSMIKLSEAEKHGGALNVFDRSTVVLHETDIEENGAKGSGGGIRCCGANIIVRYGHLSGNKAAKNGGGITATHACTVSMTEHTVAENEAGFLGGGLLLKNSTQANLSSIMLKANHAKEGGAVSLRNSTALIEASRFERNTAGKDGGAIAVGRSNVTSRDSHFAHGIAQSDGGCIAVDQNSNLTLEHTDMLSCRSMRGGAIVIRSSVLNATRLTIQQCTASKAGGGIFGRLFAKVLCSYCTFTENDAHVNGGAISIRTNASQALSYQFVRSRFLKNNSTLGGAIHLMTGAEDKRCEDHLEDCTLVGLVRTRFVQNSALVGGAIFTSAPRALWHSCSNPTKGMPRDFYNRTALRQLHPIDSAEAPCLATNNTSRDFGDFVATYARNVSLSVKGVDDKKFVEIDGTFKIEAHKSGEALPAFKLRIRDAFGQGPAFGAWNTTVQANVWSPEGLFTGNISVILYRGGAEIPGISTVKGPGDYSLTIHFLNIDLPNLNINVTVRECLLGEWKDKSRNVCSSCSTTEINFDRRAEGCQSCPTNGDCSPERVMHPRHGYWHSDPCRQHIQKCTTHAACDFPDREDKLMVSTKDFVSYDDCGNETLCQYYVEAQCKKGYEGPLCGSCADNYGRTRTLECVKCHERYANILLYLLSVILFLVLVSIVIKSHLVSGRTADIIASWCISGSAQCETEGVQPESLIEMSERRTAHLGSEVDGPQTSQTAETPEEILRRTERIKLQLVEIFKIAVNFCQVVAVALSIDYNWTSSIVQLLSTVDFLGGAATETVTLPIDCFLPFHTAIPRSVLRTIILIGIPVLVAIFFTIFWAIALYQFAKTWQYLAKRLILSYLVIAYIAYESVTKTAVDILVCVRADVSCGDVGTSFDYWAVDTSVECYEGSHSVLVGTLGWPVVLLFSLGFPVGLAFALVFIRRYAPERDVWYNEATGFLYRAYNDRFFFWESIIMLRKSLLAVIVAFGYTLGPNIQGVLAISVLTAALYFHTLFRPFDKDFDQLNAYESASLVVSQLAFIGGLLLSDDRVSKEVHVLLSIFLIITISGLSFFFLLTFCSTFVSYARIQFKLDGLEDVEAWSPARVFFTFLAFRVQKQFRFFNNDRVQRKRSDSSRPSSAA